MHIYAYIHTCVLANNNEKRSHGFQGEQGGMEGLGGRKEKGEILYYNLKNKSTTITAKTKVLG